jgi:hypothetical protein
LTGGVRTRGASALSVRTLCVLVFAFFFVGSAESQEAENPETKSPHLESATTPSTNEPSSQENPLVRSPSNVEGMPRMIIDMTPGDVQLVPHPARLRGKLSRWVNFETVSVSTRYNFIENSVGSLSSNQDQYQVVLKGAFQFDPDGRYTIQAGLFPGNRFSSGWNGSGWGTGKLRTNLYLKQLYVGAKPITGLELQYGGLYFNQGVNTEITGYDYDAYLTGERIRVTRPTNFFFDEISITYAYVSASDLPSVSKRFHRLKQSNYHQLLLAKRVGERILFSGDYTFQSGAETFREAIRVLTKEIRVIDIFHIENYQAANPDAGYGFAAYGEKKLHTRLFLGGGYAQHDRAGLYSDRFAAGKRIFLNVQLELRPEFSISTSWTQAIQNAVRASPRTRLDIALNYDVLRTLQRTKVL